jgi:type III secretory pathway component EscS
MTLTNAGNLTTVGTITGTTINASTNLQEATVNLSSKYLKLDGTNTMTGTLNGTTINASTNLQEATVNLSSKYLKLDGTNTMTGTLNGTTINASTNLQEATVNLSSKYLKLDGTNTMTGTLNGTTINASTNLQEATVNLSSKYLKLDGTNTMTGTLNGTTINASTNLQEAGTNLTSKYLRLIGGTLTGDLTGTNITAAKVSSADATGVNAACLGRLLNVVGTNAVMRIWRDSTTNSPTMEFMSGPMTSGTSYTKFWDMGIGGSTDTNYFFIRDRKPPTTAEFRLFINDAGNTGIGTSSPVSKLDVRGTIYCQNSVIADITNIGATNNYQLRLTPPSTATQYATIQSIYQSASIVYTPLILQASGGNVGIGLNPSYKFHVTAGKTSASTAFAMKVSGGVAVDSGNYGTLLGLGTEDGGFTKCAIGHVRTAGYDVGDIVFLTRNTVDPTSCDMTNERMRIYSGGGVNINGNITVNSGTSVFNNSVYITNPDSRQTHLPYLGNNQNYLRGKVNIDQDDLYVGGGVQFNSTLSIASSLSVGTTATIGGNTNIGGLLRHRQSFNYGETVSYEIGYNGSPGLDGWWWTTNGFWAGYGTASYLTIAVNATGVSAVWFGRAYLSGTGGAYSVVQDYRSPDNNNGNQITVTNQWGANGANAMRITILNGAYAGSFIIKVSG